MSQNPNKRGRKSSTEEEGVNNTSLLQNIEHTMIKLLHVTTNKMDNLIEVVKEVKEQIKINRSNNTQNIAEMEAAIFKASEKITTELQRMTASQAKVFKNIIGNFKIQQLDVKLPEWKNLLNERKMACYSFLYNTKIAEIYSS